MNEHAHISESVFAIAISYQIMNTVNRPLTKSHLIKNTTIVFVAVHLCSVKCVSVTRTHIYLYSL